MDRRESDTVEDIKDDLREFMEKLEFSSSIPKYIDKLAHVFVSAIIVIFVSVFMSRYIGIIAVAVGSIVSLIVMTVKELIDIYIEKDNDYDESSRDQVANIAGMVSGALVSYLIINTI